MEQWFVSWSSSADARQHDGTAVRLLCFPWAGGSSTIYSKWQSTFDRLTPKLGVRVEVVAIELPGRMKNEEELCTDMALLADKVAQALLVSDYVTGGIPYALFGFSFGSILAFEVCHRLVSATFEPRLPRAEPLRLFVCAAPPPQKPQGETSPCVSEMSDEQLKQFLLGLAADDLNVQPMIDSAVLFNMFAPIIRADYACLETYKILAYDTANEVRSVPVAMSVYGGTSDARAKQDVEGWLTNTTVAAGPQTIDSTGRIMQGGHFFLEHEVNLEEVLVAAAEAMREHVSSLHTETLMHKPTSTPERKHRHTRCQRVAKGVWPSRHKRGCLFALLALWFATDSDRTLGDILYTDSVSGEYLALQLCNGKMALTRNELNLIVKESKRVLSSTYGVTNGDVVAVASSSFGLELIVATLALWLIGAT
eukprot:scaffold742_cov395-Prasinococcus_capsulatus_cf.AAC.29